MARTAGRGSGPDAKLTPRALMARPKWEVLPPVAALAGTADFLKGKIVRRFVRELFGDASQEVRRYQGPPNDRQLSDLPLATVLDELRTPSFFSPYRVVVIEGANAFIAAHGEDLLPFVKDGFAGGHLLLLVDGKLDGRTRFAKAVAKEGWIVECAQPFDRPPPWDTRTPVWDSELSRWVVSCAEEKGLRIDCETAFLLHERAGTDLAVLDEELEKISTYLASKKSHTVDADAIGAVVGDLHENSVFLAIELFLEARKLQALDIVARMLERGVTVEKGSPVMDPMSIALLFVGALVPRLRALRRAHALAAQGQGPEEWMASGLVQRPFLGRFQRQLEATPPRRLATALRKLYELDRAIKSGSSPSRMLELFVLECG